MFELSRLFDRSISFEEADRRLSRDIDWEELARFKMEMEFSDSYMRGPIVKQSSEGYHAYVEVVLDEGNTVSYEIGKMENGSWEIEY